MTRLIDADSLLEALHETFHEYEEDIEFTNGIDFSMGLINEQATIDVSDKGDIDMRSYMIGYLEGCEDSVKKFNELNKIRFSMPIKEPYTRQEANE